MSTAPTELTVLRLVQGLRGAVAALNASGVSLQHYSSRAA